MSGSFLQKDPADLERFLVQQARSDRAPPAALQRAMVGLTSVSLGVGLASGAKVAWGASAAVQVTPWLITKCVAIGMTATLATFAGAEGLHRAFSASESSTTRPRPARPNDALGRPARASSATPSGPPALAAAPSAPSTRSAAASSSAAAAPLVAGAPPSSYPYLPSATAFDAVAGVGGAALAREVARLRGARASLVAGAPSAALQALDRYAHEFPAGALRAEAAALRIEAVAMLGDETRVRHLAADFLGRFPTSPLAARVRAVSGIAGESESKP
jgi:Meckel syndrome type 1 protein